MTDDRLLDDAIHRADLDELVRIVDARCAAGDWDGLLRLRDRARHALGTGRQLWPAATLAEFRLALLAPAEFAGQVLDEGSGRFTIGPLTEVVAQHHTFAELAAVVEPGPRLALTAHERVLRGESVDAASLVDVFEIPYRLADWEPAYCLAAYGDDGAEFPAPPLPSAAAFGEMEELPGGTPVTDDPAVGTAARDLVEPWTASSNGHCEVAAVTGTARHAVSALGLTHARFAPLGLPEAAAWLAWAGASGGAFGRRRGAALGRFGTWWLLAAVTGCDGDWPVDAAELGEASAALRWWWFDTAEPATGWQLHIAVEDPEDGLSWAISASDAT